MIEKNAEFWQRQTNIRRAPKADLHTRVALVVAERGLTEKQLKKFYKVRRRREYFDYFYFAEKQHVSIDWLIDGVLALHPRTPASAAKDRRSVLRIVDAVQPGDGGAA
jgi:hypothetical protein